MDRLNGLFRYISKYRDLSMAIGFIFLIMMIIIPMPTVVLDLLLSCNLLLSVMIVLNVLYIKSVLEFTVFPSMLLIFTVFSLALNISSTRLILTKGENFDGTIIRSFGSFVVGSSGTEGLVVGSIIFIIIIAVQFIVITKGATRIAEVSARFRLDGMPGKQMAIDAEFTSGNLTEEEYTIKKTELQQEVDFYGSMDGASKFVSGNVKAGIFITFINIVGGLIVGVIVRNENITNALNNYVQLTIGDGLVSQLPALLVSTATGIIVTRAVSKEGNLTEDVLKDFSNYQKIYYISGGFLCLLALLPGFPWYLLLPMGGLLLTGAIISSKKQAIQVEEEKRQQSLATKEQVATPRLEPLDPIVLEIGYDLIPLIKDEEGKAELLNRVTTIRRELGVKLGIIIPLMRIIDSVLLNSSEYSIKLHGVEIAKGSVMINRLLAIHNNRSNLSEVDLEGDRTTDPAFNIPAIWIYPNDRTKAERLGFTVADPTAVISTHISTVLEKHVPEMLSRQDVSNMLDQYQESYPVTINEVRKHLEIGHIQHVFKHLLQERVSLRNLTNIFETLADYGAITKDIDFLVEKSRQALSRQITNQYVDEHNTLYAYTFEHQIERIFTEDYTKNPSGGPNMIPPQLREKLLQVISNSVKPQLVEEEQGLGKVTTVTKQVVLLTSEFARPYIHQLLAGSINKNQYSIPVLSMLEISDDCHVKQIDQIRLDALEKPEQELVSELEEV